jgi:phosphomevalonate kinase
MTRVLAPGKAILCGEYAVLHGAPAISVAVDRCVRGWIGPGQGTALSPFLIEAMTRAHALLKELGKEAPELLQSGFLGVDSSALFDGRDKLGLGSSAAVTVAALGAALAHHGVSLDDKRKIFEIADAAHQAAQGTRGSGIDVATAVYGGAIRFQRQGGEASIQEIALPSSLRLTFVYTGKPASTPELIGRVKALAEAQPARHEACIGRLTMHAQAFAAAAASDDLPALIAAASSYGDAMAHLGEASGAPIVTQAHAQMAALARRHGGAAKPSGAGGGDLGVAFTTSSEATAALHADLVVAELTPLAIGAPAPGLRMEIV